jgi:hypothetical protein
LDIQRNPASSSALLLYTPIDRVGDVSRKFPPYN